VNLGVLALQGAVREHLKMIESLGHHGLIIKKPEELSDVDGLILPGGESTTMGKLLNKYNFLPALNKFHQQKKPIFGTCAGLILLAKEINNSESVHLAFMDIKVERNAFGRQRESFEADLDILGFSSKFRAVFIRAPYIMEVGKGVDILSKFADKIVLAKEGHLLASAFHPELTEDTRVHQIFIEMVENRLKQLA